MDKETSGHNIQYRESLVTTERARGSTDCVINKMAGAASANLVLFPVIYGLQIWILVTTRAIFRKKTIFRKHIRCLSLLLVSTFIFIWNWSQYMWFLVISKQHIIIKTCLVVDKNIILSFDYEKVTCMYRFIPNFDDLYRSFSTQDGWFVATKPNYRSRLYDTKKMWCS